MPICYSCDFNKKEFEMLTMCTVKTKKEKLNLFYIESDSNGDLYLNFCTNCVLYGFTEGKQSALNGAKSTGRYELSNY